MSGFYLVRLSLRGEGIKTSSIGFKKGLNIVYGGSDIGKTFIYQCIDYLLGGGINPKEIKESRNYNEYELEIKDYDGDSHLIYKDQKKNYFLINGEKCYLDNKNKKKTISDFLLSLAKIEGKSIEIDKYGQTKDLFFQNLRNYFLLDEDNIIAKKSKIAGYEFKERGVFRFMVTEEDDSNTTRIASDSDIVTKKKNQKRINNKIKELHEEIEVLEDFGLLKIDFPTLIKERLDDIEIKFIEQVKFSENNKALCPSCGNILVCKSCEEKQESSKKIIFKEKKQLKEEVNFKLKKVEEEYYQLVKNSTRIEILKREKESYQKELEELNKEIIADDKKLSNLKAKQVASSKVKPITDIMLNILQKIDFDDIKHVEFSPAELDFLINNESRGVYGQGYRAIIYATFLIAILEYLDDKPYGIGFTMIDSPFNPYKVKNEKDKNLAHNFYAYLDSNPVIDSRQVIIFENTKPPKEFDKRMTEEFEDGFLGNPQPSLFD